MQDLLDDAESGFSDLFRRLLAHGYQQLQEANRQSDNYRQKMQRQSRRNEAIQRLQTIPGYGLIVAGVFHSVVGNGEAYRRGRNVSASLGLVPRQHHRSGGKDTLLGISKRADRYLWSLLVRGARSVVIRAAQKDDVRVSHQGRMASITTHQQVGYTSAIRFLSHLLEKSCKTGVNHIRKLLAFVSLSLASGVQISSFAYGT